MRRLGRLGAQGVALLDAEPVLLVDHHQGEVVEVDALVQQGVRADDDAGAAVRDLGQRGPPGRRAERTGDQGQLRAVGVAVQLAGPAQRAQLGTDAAVVLGGEHLGRRQQRGLAARVDDLEHRADRDEGLARADLAL
nr:hypothetical protein GCM10020092_017280 [Actinoplanes digitatis]